MRMATFVWGSWEQAHGPPGSSELHHLHRETLWSCVSIEELKKSVDAPSWKRPRGISHRRRILRTRSINSTGCLGRRIQWVPESPIPHPPRNCNSAASHVLRRLWRNRGSTRVQSGEGSVNLVWAWHSWKLGVRRRCKNDTGRFLLMLDFCKKYHAFLVPQQNLNPPSPMLAATRFVLWFSKNLGALCTNSWIHPNRTFSKSWERRRCRNQNKLWQLSTFCIRKRTCTRCKLWIPCQNIWSPTTYQNVVGQWSILCWNRDRFRVKRA